VLALSEISRCFEGEIPSLLVTCSAAGEPNLAHLSRVFLMDDGHVATSNQFFTKTVANLAANPSAVLMCVDPLTLISYKLLLCLDHSEDAGALFEKVRRSIEVIASLTGMTNVFALRSVDVFRVLNVEAVPVAEQG
jgi:adenylate cyclase